MKKFLLSAMFFIAISMNSQTMALTGTFINWPQTPTTTLFATTDNINYTLSNFTLANNSDVKFTQGTWSTSGGCTTPGTCFPNGTTDLTDKGSNIAVPAGVYNVSINRVTGVYSFAAVAFNAVNVSGSAVGSTPLTLQTIDGSNYFRRGVDLSNGVLLLNQTAPSAITWSGTAFPSGTATAGTSGIPITAGRYNMTFNRTSGAYSFNPVIFTIIGNGVGGFDSNNEIALTTTNGVNYSLASVTIGVTNGSSIVKFRENNDWALQIGNPAWPTGTGAGTSDDPNIAAVPGTYSVMLNRVTREYSFATLSNENFTKYNFDFYPNPTTNVWNFKSASNIINSITVVDAVGKTVINVNPNAIETTVDASALSSGIYFAKVTSDNRTQSVKLIKK